MQKPLLKISTAGSVDDGKSTLIGRLLYDTKTIWEDNLEEITRSKVNRASRGIDFSLLTDGLRAEREQGITIDVAYRYFATPRRKFIIADTPGHEQYTRNMATGASNCSLAIVLIDARHGVVTQTRRHSFIVSLLGIKHIVVAVNKMDLVDWSERVFLRIRDEYNDAVARLSFADIQFIPLSALKGDNLVTPGANMPWYGGPTLLHHLENVNLASERNLVDLRFPVQYVLRPNADFRGFAGTVASGVLRVGDEVLCLPSRRKTRVKSIVTDGGELTEAFPPMSVVATLADEVDVSRGGMLVHPNNLPKLATECEVMLVWMHEDPAQPGGRYLVKHTANLAPATLAEIRYQIDVNTLRKTAATGLELNQIGRARLTFHRALAFDDFARHPQTGSLILIDRLTNATVAAGMILDRAVLREPAGEAAAVRHVAREHTLVGLDERERLLGQRGATVWLTGLSGAGKSTIAKEMERQLIRGGHPACILDGDNIRHGLNRDLGFGPEDRRENIRRIAEVARLFNEAGLMAISAFISPYRADRDNARSIVGADRWIEVYVRTPLAVCEARDPKGLYRKARRGEIPQFTGVTDPYEPPLTPDVSLDTADTSPEDCARILIAELARRRFLSATTRTP